MYGEELAEVYELVYRSRGKNWAEEAHDVAKVIRARLPEADSLLDVACGTGAHLATFRESFARAEGLEIAEPMRRLARRRLPGVRITAGDMRDFDLGRRFDAVCCMFCAIGYLSTVAELRAAAACMARHLTPGGVLVVEPWWFPERFIEGYVAADLAQEGGRAVARMSHSTRQGDATRMEVRFLVGDSAGIREFTEIDVLTLFTREQYTAAFTDAGCDVEYLEGGPTGRGLFVGIRR
ncbi:class I SAM-dependent methyltransferase [Marinitenerispora sediminis]|uniref:SAM-dependent methyltransferase n=1 Tax=Marinitenerispora sediminis TaxID=1931232 RepID=A0A368T2G6_9ACTN|nr:class I SAM-dependent methyltransferase [Marinitenerispora sediminis]RCV47747.1 SAM-dependent methyltransferase [Marinitenerispora sediminis]RCV48302.1 SAM-dependent methyltransferase [Marinitenerispora sediminis]RCV50241.1 SAM-dependent methyltransferase [Marinitenerispora sediminis]